MKWKSKFSNKTYTNKWAMNFHITLQKLCDMKWSKANKNHFKSKQMFWIWHRAKGLLFALLTCNNNNNNDNHIIFVVYFHECRKNTWYKPHVTFFILWIRSILRSSWQIKKRGTYTTHSADQVYFFIQQVAFIVYLKKYKSKKKKFSMTKEKL